MVQQKDNLCNNCSLYVVVRLNTECTSISGTAAMLLLLIVPKEDLYENVMCLSRTVNTQIQDTALRGDYTVFIYLIGTMLLQPQKFAPYRIARFWNFAIFDVLLPRPAEYNETS